MDKKRTIFEIVNFIGSIASITGISLLWFKGSSDTSPIQVVWIALIVSLCFGFLTLCVAIIRYIYLRWIRSWDVLWKITYFALAAPLIFCLAVFIGALVIIYLEKGIENILFR